MALAASVILDGAATTLLDQDGISYPRPTLLGWLNEALRATAFVKPDMYVKDTDVALVAGITQELPADAVALINIPQNSGTGRVITQVPAKLLDECNRFWPSATRQAAVEHYTSDPRNALRFRIYPPNDGTGSVEMVYGAVPPTIATEDDDIPVKDSYQTALTDFVLGKAYAENSKKGDITKATASMQSWGRALGIKTGAQIALAPKVAAEPGVAG